MRVLALDYGSRRCGCAISDPSGTLATPIDVVEHPDTEDGIAAIKAAIRQRSIDRVVVGMPTTLKGELGAQADETRQFVERLRAAVEIAVETYDERLTTKMAEATTAESRGKGLKPRSSTDSVAAAHLLNTYLESLNS